MRTCPATFRMAAVSVACVAIALPALARDSNDQSIWSRSKLTGDWRGLRKRAEDQGFTIDLTATYALQGVASGGFDGPLFDRFSDENDVGNTLAGDLTLALDTGKAGWWPGGSFNAEVEGRVGKSVLHRAGTVSAVNTDATFPNVVDRFDESTIAVTNLTFTQYVGLYVSLFGGLVNGAEGDSNEFAGESLSTSHFLNSALLSSLVENATSPNTSLGGGLSFEPNEHVSGSFVVFGTEETAGENPFDPGDGITFNPEWTLSYQLLQLGGAQTFGFLYGIDASRAAIATDPRLVLEGVLQGQSAPTTNDDTWALYYNAHQYVHGGDTGGWGVFVRFGLSDGDPNPIRWNMAAGFGGAGLVPIRPQDTWGMGTFYLGMSDEDLLRGLDVGDEVGGEVYYNIALTPWFHLTLDAQGIDSALPGVDTTCVLGMRTNVDF